jgi:hypothetical protein
MSKISITIDGETLEEVRANMTEMLGRLGGTDSTQVATDAPAPAAEKTETPATPAAAPAAAPAPAKGADEGDAAVDADGMPYDPAVHAATRTMTADGLWKAQRGKAAEAKAARAAFKAQGANETAPAAAGLPGAAEEKSTGLPGAENLPDADPVTLEEAVDIAQKALGDNVIDTPGLLAMYSEITGKADANEAFAVFQTDETARARLVDAIEAKYE